MLFTAIEDLTGHEEQCEANRAAGLTHKADTSRTTWSEARADWSARISHDISPHTLTPQEIAFCTGAYGPPNMPDFAGAKHFDGTLIHSSAYSEGGPHSGKRAVVIGSGSSAHDVAVNLWEVGPR